MNGILDARPRDGMEADLAYLNRAFYLKNHPVLRENLIYRENYCCALIRFTENYKSSDTPAITAMLECYCCLFSGNMQPELGNESSFVLDCRSHYDSNALLFMMDCLFLCAFANKSRAASILPSLKSAFGEGYHEQFDSLFSVLYDGGFSEDCPEAVKEFVCCWRRGQMFSERPVKNILVTATMSAGKSTLINAIVGKPLMRMAQEACTDHLYRLYNKPFEDNITAFKDSRITFHPDYNTFVVPKVVEKCHIATCYKTFAGVPGPVCIIDTPGVNSALNRAHGKLTKQAVKNCRYDLLVYVLNSNRLGTDDESSYLKFIAANVPKENVVFVLNKMDAFRGPGDSIDGSIQGVKNDLFRLGYKTPAVLPVSAYCSLLIKLKLTGSELNEDEEDEFNRYVKKYYRTEHDLSRYYDTSYANAGDDILTQMSIKCGLYGLETKLFGGESI